MSLYNMSKSQWGPPTWSLLHCLSIKAKDTMNKEQLEDVKRLIQLIVQNLPCPICSTHAISHFNKFQFKSIRTLAELRTYLWDFHNNVNSRTDKPRITFEEHLLIYQRMDFSNVLQHFIQTYQHISNTTVTMMLYSFHRQTMLKQVSLYFKSNAYLFTA